MILVVPLLQVSFIGDKLTDIFQNELYRTESTIVASKGSVAMLSVGRMAGFVHNINSALQRPILGFGNFLNIQIAGGGYNVVSMSGIGNFLMLYGLFGLVVLIFCFRKAIFSMKSKFKIRYAYIYILIFIFHSLSFNLIFNQIYFALLFIFVAFLKVENKNIRFPSYIDGSLNRQK
jgi:hypothetical protein